MDYTFTRTLYDLNERFKREYETFKYQMSNGHLEDSHPWFTKNCDDHQTYMCAFGLTDEMVRHVLSSDIPLEKLTIFYNKAINLFPQYGSMYISRVDNSCHEMNDTIMCIACRVLPYLCKESNILWDKLEGIFQANEFLLNQCSSLRALSLDPDAHKQPEHDVTFQNKRDNSGELEKLRSVVREYSPLLSMTNEDTRLQPVKGFINELLVTRLDAGYSTPDMDYFSIACVLESIMNDRDTKFFAWDYLFSSLVSLSKVNDNLDSSTFSKDCFLLGLYFWKAYNDCPDAHIVFFNYMSKLMNCPWYHEDAASKQEVLFYLHQYYDTTTSSGKMEDTKILRNTICHITSLVNKEEEFFEFENILLQLFEIALCKEDALHFSTKCLIEFFKIFKRELVSNLINKLLEKHESEVELYLYKFDWLKNSESQDPELYMFLSDIAEKAPLIDFPERLYNEVEIFSLTNKQKLEKVTHTTFESTLKQLRNVSICGGILENSVEQLEEQILSSKKRKLEDSDKERGDTTAHAAKRLNDTFVKNREYTTVIVKNLPMNYNFHKVKRYFYHCGQITHVDVSVASDKESKVARIEFATYEGALSALTKTYKKLNNHEIVVNFLKDATLWVTNFAPNSTVETLKALFSQYGGSVLSVRLPSLKFDSNRRFAYIDFASSDEANTAMSKLNNTSHDGYILVVKKSNPHEKSKRTDAATLEKREIFIRKLDFYKVSLSKLTKLVEKYGPVERVSMPNSEDSVNSNKQNDGFAFVTYTNEESAQKALELNMSVFEGRVLAVSIADRKPYLERQEVKRILNTKKPQNDMISMYPFTDKVSKDQLRALITEKASLKDEDIKAIYLVADHEGAVIQLESERIAAKVTMALHGIEFKRKVLKCGSVFDLKRHIPVKQSSQIKQKLTSERTSQVTASSEEQDCIKPKPDSRKTKMSNDDFRLMFLGAK